MDLKINQISMGDKTNLSTLSKKPKSVSKTPIK